MALIAVLLDAEGRLLSLYERAEDARERCDRYNAEPFVADGEHDLCAPYSVELWAVRASSASGKDAA